MANTDRCVLFERWIFIKELKVQKRAQLINQSIKFPTRLCSGWVPFRGHAPAAKASETMNSSIKKKLFKRNEIYMHWVESQAW